jgi:hypothetical protein
MAMAMAMAMATTRVREKGVEVQTRPCSCKMKHWRLEKVAPENRNCLEEEGGPRRAYVTESHSLPKPPPPSVADSASAA